MEPAPLGRRRLGLDPLGPMTSEIRIGGRSLEELADRPLEPYVIVAPGTEAADRVRAAMQRARRDLVYLGTCPNDPCVGVEHDPLPSGGLECRRCGCRWMPRRAPVDAPLTWEGDQA